MTDFQKQALAHLISQLRNKQITGKDFQLEATKLLGPERYTELIRMPASEQQQQQQRMAQQQASAKEQKEEDAFDKLDGAALQDVLRYSNIDLKAESELILGSSAASKHVPTSITHPSVLDVRSKPTHYCNASRLRYIVTKMASRTNPSLIKSVDEDAMMMIAAALQRRMSDILTSCIEYSRHRVDRGRANWKIKIVNDPRKQIGILEQVIRAEEKKLDKEGRQRGEEGGGEAMNSKMDVEQRTSTLEQRPPPQKKARPTPAAPILSTESTSIKAKMANSAVMAAVGLKRKEWMTSTPSSVITGGSGGSSVTGGHVSMDTETVTSTPILEPSISFSTAPSTTFLTDSQLYAAFVSRTINARDLGAVVESDPKLAKSHISLLLYDLANQE